MSKIYVLGSNCGQGKTTTAVNLANYFTSQNLKVACLQTNKGRYDAGFYLKNDCYHYTIPLEATKNRDILAQWLPKGYDVFIMEISFPYFPIGASYADLFYQVNEIISSEHKDDWEAFIRSELLKWYSCGKILSLWDLFHSRTVQPVITKTDGDIGTPCVDTNLVIHHVDEFVYDEIEPQMVLPSSENSAIAVGTFPAEYWDIFPALKWYGYNYSAFSEVARNNSYDIAIIGGCADQSLKLDIKGSAKAVICYQPSLLSERMFMDYHNGGKISLNPVRLMEAIRTKPVGTTFSSSNKAYSMFNNRFWVSQKYSGDDILEKEGDILFCNGWVLPQYLLREGLLEV